MRARGLFGDATYALNRNRQVKLQRPEQLPCDDDVETLKQYTVERIPVAKVVSDPYKMWHAHAFVELRNLTVR